MYNNPARLTGTIPILQVGLRSVGGGRAKSWKSYWLLAVRLNRPGGQFCQLMKHLLHLKFGTTEEISFLGLETSKMLRGKLWNEYWQGERVRCRVKSKANLAWGHCLLHSACNICKSTCKIQKQKEPNRQQRTGSSNHPPIAFDFFFLACCRIPWKAQWALVCPLACEYGEGEDTGGRGGYFQPCIALFKTRLLPAVPPFGILAYQRTEQPKWIVFPAYAEMC